MNDLTRICMLLSFAACADNVTPIQFMDTSDITTGWREPGINCSCEGRPLTVGGKSWKQGLGVHAPSKATFDLDKACKRFEATVGVDDESFGTIEFKVWGDGKLLWQSGKISARDKVRTKDVIVDTANVDTLVLEVTDWDGNRDGDHADWLDARFVYRDGAYGENAPSQIRQLGILTPAERAAPRINGTRVLGVRPEHPVIFHVPVTGIKPMKVTVENLPKGLVYDQAKQLIAGSIAKEGVYHLVFKAENEKGNAQREFTIKVGDKIGLTPAMGWNSWNCFAGSVTADKVKNAADAMVKSGLIEHGWTYINIDDFWQNQPGTKDVTLIGPERYADGTINPNKRFPTMMGLADYIHEKGLKAGLYSSPGPKTCGGCTGSWQRETQDAKTYAEWGYDFLKYDWCSYGKVAIGDGLRRAMYPYLVMGKALKEQNRDIVFSLCQYGCDNVSTWGALAYGHSWRTTGDVFDKWTSISCAINRQKPLWYFSAPGAFNDPDMLCVGPMVWNGFKGSRLTHNEQYTHISIWALVASPLMIGCDMTKLDDFTKSLLTNDEVIEIDQDELGKGAACVSMNGRGEVWMRPLANGDIAAGLYNRGAREIVVTVDMANLGLEGKWKVRDCWRQQEEGEFSTTYSFSVPGHATHLVRFSGGRLRAGMNDVRENAWMRELNELRK